MPSEFKSIFVRLREILRKHAARFSVRQDGSDRYELDAPVDPAALRAWSGKMKRPMIPVAWVQIGKAYVSYHLMGVYGNPSLRDSMSKELKARMQGKTCFNFRCSDEVLFRELEQLTADAVNGFRKAGFISGQKSA